MFSIFICIWEEFSFVFGKEILNIENVFGLIYNFLFSQNENNENAFGLFIFSKLKIRTQLNKIKFLGFLVGCKWRNQNFKNLNWYLKEFRDQIE